MKRLEFKKFCKENGLVTVDAGRDWFEAGVRGMFLCARVDDESDFEAIEPLLDNNEAYLASAEIKNGQSWYYHNGYGGCLNAYTAQGVAQEMSEEYANFLSNCNSMNIAYESQNDIAERDRVLAKYPALPDEEQEKGIWSYTYDNWKQDVICVLIDDESDDNEEEE